MKPKTIISWVLRLAGAIILLQTLFFKFTAAPESVELFSQLGAEPVGRIGVGIAELITSILLLVPKTVWLGALGGIGLMLGAIGSHVFVLGIEVGGDGGLLFILAVIVLLASTIILFLHKDEIKNPLAAV
ncbi:MAG: DoxX family membrane protein [Bacteroidota bacterium]